METPNSSNSETSMTGEGEGHLLVLLSGCRLQCRVCNEQKAAGYKNKVKFGCWSCKVGFHPQCFSAFHDPQQLKNAGLIKAYDAIMAIRHSISESKRKRGNGNNKFGGAEKFAKVTDESFPFMRMETNEKEKENIEK